MAARVTVWALGWAGGSLMGGYQVSAGFGLAVAAVAIGVVLQERQR